MRVVGGLLKNKIKEKNTPIQIPIPIYMKTNMGFEPGTSAYFFIPGGEGDTRREIFLSQINPFDWSDLWKFNIILKERVGVVSEILELILKKKAWSCITETITTEWNNKHEISVIFKPKRNRKIRGSSDTIIASLRRALYERLQDKLHDDFFIYGHPDITPMKYLHSLWKRMKEFESERTQNQKINIQKYTGKITVDGWVEVPEVYQKMVSEYFHATSKIFVFSDTEEKYVKYSFHNDSDTMYWLDIEYSKIEFLRWSLRFLGENRINILGSYSLPIKIVRNKVNKVFGVYSTILQLDDYIERNFDGDVTTKGTIQIVKNLERDLKMFVTQKLSRKNTQIKNEIHSGIRLQAKIYNPKKRKKFDYCPKNA